MMIQSIYTNPLGHSSAQPTDGNESMVKVTSLKNDIETTGLIREKVYRHLRDEICHGRIKPGERMRESRLSEQIGTSRTPVREALHLLERDGLLVSIPRVGYQVKEVSWDEVEEIVQIRIVNETLALRWAIQRMDEVRFKALEDNISKTEAALLAGQAERMVEFDAEFHEILVRTSGSDRLLDLCRTLRRHMLRYRVGSLSHPEVAMRALEGHKRILARIADNDYRGGKKVLREHLEISKRDIRRTKFAPPDRS